MSGLLYIKTPPPPDPPVMSYAEIWYVPNYSSDLPLSNLHSMTCSKEYCLFAVMLFRSHVGGTT